MFYYVIEWINLIYNLFFMFKLKFYLYFIFNKILLVLMVFNFIINYVNVLEVIFNMLIDFLIFKCLFFFLYLVYNSFRFKKNFC